MSKQDFKGDSKQFTAEEIEQELDKIEEEEKADFDQWFNSYVKDPTKDEDDEQPITDNIEAVEAVEQPTTETTDNVETTESSNNDNNVETSDNDKIETVSEDDNNNDKIETVDDNSNNNNVETVDNNSNETVEQPITETTDKDDDNSSNNTTPEAVETVEQPAPEQPSVSNPSAYTLSDIQKQQHKTVKTNVEVKHRKHRSRKTELSSSVPPKQPITIQETENGKVEIGTEKAEKLSDEEIEKKIKKAATKLTNDIKDQVKTMEQNGNCRKLDPLNYTVGTENYNIFKHYMFDMLLVPKRCVTRFNLNEYISSITIFNYNCFDSPNVAMQHPIPEKVIFTEKLNSLFDFQFANSKQGDFHFADLDAQLLKFINIHSDKGTLTFEYRMIRSALGKFILALNTDVELALRDNTRPTINSAFKQVIIRDIQQMKFIQNPNGKTFTSWKAFLDTLLNVGSDKLIYVHDNYRNLNSKLELAYGTDFLIENLLGNTLKCYLPSIALNYFYAIKSVYIISRLVSIYIQLRLFKDKTPEQIMNDLFVIAVCGTIIYENKSFIFKQATRTLPGYDKPLSNETKLYILNHLLTGGQYYILKMIEESLPVIASDLK